MLLQVALFAASSFLLAEGRTQLAVAALAFPLQLCLFLWLSHRKFLALSFFAALLPVSMLELLPRPYMYLVVYAGSLALAATHSQNPHSHTESEGRESAAGIAPFSWSRTLDRLPLPVLGIMLSIAAVNAYVHGWGSVDLMRYCAMGYLFLAAIWIFGTRPESSRDIRRLLDLTTTSYALVAAVYLIAFQGPAAFLMEKSLKTLHGVANLNAVAAHAAAATAYLLVRAVLERRRGVRVARLLLLCVPLLVLVLSRSRGAWLGFGVSLIYVVVLTKSFWLMLSGAAATAALVVNDLFKLAVASRVEATGVEDPALLGRLLLWHSAVTVGLDNWLAGVGFLNFRHVKHHYGFPWPRAVGLPFNSHNLYLEFFVGLGLLGLLAFLWLLVSGTVGAHRVHSDKGGSFQPEALGIAAMLIGFAVHGLLDAVIWQHGMLMLLGMLLGLAMSVRRLQVSR